MRCRLRRAFPERRDDDHQHRGCVDGRLDRIFAVKPRACAAPLRGLGASRLDSTKQTADRGADAVPSMDQTEINLHRNLLHKTSDTPGARPTSGLRRAALGGCVPKPISLNRTTGSAGAIVG